MRLPAPPRPRTVTALAAAAVGAAAVLGAVPASAAGAGHAPIGHLDAVTVSGRTIAVRGWAGDRDAPRAPLTMTVTLDGRVAGHTRTGTARPDVARAVHLGPATGFTQRIPAGWGRHVVCVSAGDAAQPAHLTGLGCATVAVHDPNSPSGAFLGATVRGRTATLTGWAFDPSDLRHGTPVRIYRDGRLVTTVAASQPQASVDRAYHVAGNNGWTAAVALTPGAHRLCATAMNVGAGASNWDLGCRTASVPVPVSVGDQVAAAAKHYVGGRYVDGGTTPAGFDCSGLTQYLYAHVAHRAIPRTAQEQYVAARGIARSAARPGDLVFFHDGSGYVYHVGVYEGGTMMVAAATPADGVRYQTIWSSAVTFGTFLH